MKEKINVFDYSEQIMKALRRGILLNTNGDKFNSMVISWGHFGIIWVMISVCQYTNCYVFLIIIKARSVDFPILLACLLS